MTLVFWKHFFISSPLLFYPGSASYKQSLSKKFVWRFEEVSCILNSCNLFHSDWLIALEGTARLSETISFFEKHLTYKDPGLCRFLHFLFSNGTCRSYLKGYHGIDNNVKEMDVCLLHMIFFLCSIFLICSFLGNS